MYRRVEAARKVLDIAEIFKSTDVDLKLNTSDIEYLNALCRVHQIQSDQLCIKCVDGEYNYDPHFVFQVNIPSETDHSVAVVKWVITYMQTGKLVCNLSLQQYENAMTFAWSIDCMFLKTVLYDALMIIAGDKHGCVGIINNCTNTVLCTKASETCLKWFQKLPESFKSRIVKYYPIQTLNGVAVIAKIQDYKSLNDFHREKYDAIVNEVVRNTIKYIHANAQLHTQA